MTHTITLLSLRLYANLLETVERKQKTQKLAKGEIKENPKTYKKSSQGNPHNH